MGKVRQLLGWFLAGVLLVGTITACTGNKEKGRELTLVSYAVTENAYHKIISQFTDQWKKKTGETVIFNESYGGSGAQTRAVIDGLEADIVALALGLDIDKIAKAGLLRPGWAKKFPHNSVPYTSVVGLVGREGKIKTWSDLANNPIKVITANPKTSGVARWNFLALWGAITQAGGTEKQATEFIKNIYKNAPILPRDARDASDIFYRRGQGNVLINYENEILLINKTEKLYPYFIPTDYNISIDSPVAIVDKNVEKHKTRKIAEAFVQFLYRPEAQKIFAESGFRVREPTIAAQYISQYPPIKNLFTVQDLGGWEKIEKDFFAEGALFDKILNTQAK